MPRNRSFTADYLASWLALLAMLLLSVGPLLSQLTAPAEPAWLTELACGEHVGRHDNPLDHDALWAKCGYCTLLLNSPATGCASPTLALAAAIPADRHAAPVRSGVVRSAIFPGSRSRAPPAYS
ncbi:DUF2946 domain-containing protein [Pseudomonas sp. 32.2.56]|uniref:DUF2946 domain-containing protein n=1 Tax=Pseudomonas sp. 32.2.56 TaxID=2969303 RepID=UPI0021504418|nr:DUF2946 domain-containing protein [Pseudomonas sp. 32.2.56]MCR4509229.1 DUF2946 domain-containing protein [Pseudomonas sp. 32.2.56]